MSKRFTVVTVVLSAAVAFLVGLHHRRRADAGADRVDGAAGAAAASGRAPSRPGWRTRPTVVNFADVAERINAAVVNIDSTSKTHGCADPQRYFRRGDGPAEGPGGRAISTRRGRARAAASSSIATATSSPTTT